MSTFRKVISNLSAIDTSSEDKTEALETVKQIMGQIIRHLETTRTTENTLTEKVEVAQTVADAGNLNVGGYQSSFYGQNLGSSVTSIELMGDNTVIGNPFAKTVTISGISVKFSRASGTPPGNWTLRIQRNGTEIATFAVPTT